MILDRIKNVSSHNGMGWHRKNAKLDQFWGVGASSQAYLNPISCPSQLSVVGLPISPQLPLVFDLRYMRQKLIPRTNQRPSLLGSKA